MRSIDVNVDNNNDYLFLVDDILANEEFRELSTYIHHNSNRFQHSLNVSYYSYRMAKKLGMDYTKVARGALLHDFFLIDNHKISKYNRLITLFKHSEYALETSCKHYSLSEMEKNIIVSHMFPFGIKLPKYKESILVDIIDDYISIYEAIYAKKNELSAACTFLFVCMLNFIFRW